MPQSKNIIMSMRGLELFLKSDFSLEDREKVLVLLPTYFQYEVGELIGLGETHSREGLVEVGPLAQQLLKETKGQYRLLAMTGRIGPITYQRVNEWLSTRGHSPLDLSAFGDDLNVEVSLEPLKEILKGHGWRVFFE